MNWRRVVLVLSTSLSLLLATASISQAADPIIQQPDAVATTGHSYGEWGAIWWQQILAVPASSNPTLDPTGASCQLGQPGGPVFFLAGVLGSGTSVIRTCTRAERQGAVLSFYNSPNAYVGSPLPAGVPAPCDVLDTPEKLRQDLL